MSLQHNGSAVDGGQSSAAAAHQQAAAAAAAMQTAMVDLQQQQQQPSVADLQAAASANCAAPGANGANASQLSSSPSSSVLELRCLLDNASVGGIIGRGGACVAVVREQSGAVVSIVKADTRHAPERIMILKGHAQQIAVAAKCCAQLLLEAASRREEHPVETASLRLLIHKTGVGAIIGRAGATIKEIQAETGARVQVSNETLPQSSEKTVTVTGSAAQMYAAMLRIATQLLASPLKVGTKIYAYVPGNSAAYAAAPYAAQSMPFTQQAAGQALHLYAPQGSPLHQQPFAGLIRPPAPPAVLSTQKIAIPTICCGSIIGRAGAVIKSLRQQSGTNISISDPDESTPNERVVTLSGTPQNISHAVFLIRGLVEAYQPPSVQQQQQNTQQTQQVQQQVQQQQQQLQPALY